MNCTCCSCTRKRVWGDIGGVSYHIAMLHWALWWQKVAFCLFMAAQWPLPYTSSTTGSHQWNSRLVCAQRSSFACPLTRSSAVHFPHQACRSLTAVSRSSLWLIAQQGVNNVTQAWCDSTASAKTPALTIYNTLEASQSPTLLSHNVGCTSFSHYPLSLSSPLGSAILVTKLLLCNWLNDSIDLQLDWL